MHQQHIYHLNKQVVPSNSATLETYVDSSSVRFQRLNLGNVEIVLEQGNELTPVKLRKLADEIDIEISEYAARGYE